MTMELRDTIKMMDSPDYNDRFMAEYYQLQLRADKLANMLGKYKAGTLTFKPSCDYELLYEQLIFMWQYMRILELRAKIEGVALNG